MRNACKERFKIYRKENSGVSDSRNFGALKATGNLIFFLDADDIIKVNCLEILNDLVDKNPSCSVFCGNFEIIKKDSVLIPKFCKLDRTCNISNTFKQIYFGNIFLRAGNTLIDKEVFLEIGGFKKNLSFYEDVGFFLDLVRSNNVVYTPEVIFSYEQEYTYLSKNVAALSKDWSYSVSFQNKSIYEKLIISTIIYASWKKRINNGNHSTANKLFYKHIKYIPLIIISKLLTIRDRF